MHKTKHRYHALTPEQEAMVYNQNPQKRLLAAVNGWGTDILIEDEDWLVRHAAKKTIRRQELDEQGVVLSPGDIELADLDISDIAYELFKQDWLNKNTTPESRLENVREWCSRQLANIVRYPDSLSETYEWWCEESGYGGKRYPGYYEFCGAFQPNHIGIYHNREYMAELFGYDEQLMALYETDINDTAKSIQPGLIERLDEAMAKSAETEQKGKEKQNADIDLT